MKTDLLSRQKSLTNVLRGAVTRAITNLNPRVPQRPGQKPPGIATPQTESAPQNMRRERSIPNWAQIIVDQLRVSAAPPADETQKELVNLLRELRDWRRNHPEDSVPPIIQPEGGATKDSGNVIQDSAEAATGELSERGTATSNDENSLEAALQNTQTRVGPELQQLLMQLLETLKDPSVAQQDPVNANQPPLSLPLLSPPEDASDVKSPERPEVRNDTVAQPQSRSIRDTVIESAVRNSFDALARILEKRAALRQQPRNEKAEP
jgi:hypothetical protein